MELSHLLGTFEKKYISNILYSVEHIVYTIKAVAAKLQFLENQSLQSQNGSILVTLEFIRSAWLAFSAQLGLVCI